MVVQLLSHVHLLQLHGLCSLSGSSVPEILQDHWRRLPFPSQGVFPHIGMEPRSPALQMDSLLAEPPGKPRAVLVLQNLVESPRELPYAADASYWLLVFQVTQLVKKKKASVKAGDARDVG